MQLMRAVFDASQRMRAPAQRLSRHLHACVDRESMPCSVRGCLEAFGMHAGAAGGAVLCAVIALYDSRRRGMRGEGDCGNMRALRSEQLLYDAS